MDRTMPLSTPLLAGATALALGVAAPLAAAADALQPVAFGTGWLAQAEHGGWYQALADGTYERFGLDVEIVMGGPQTPMMQRLAAGQIQFMQGGTLGVFDAVSNGIPVIAVAAFLQKDPQALLTHPDRGFTDLGDLAQLGTIYLGGSGYDTFFRWMQGRYEGFTDAQYAPYTYNPAVFIADPDSAMQAYVTSEPFDIENRTGGRPTSSCSRITASGPMPTRSSPWRRWWPRTLISCSASSMPRRLAGTTISTAIPRRPTP